MAFGPEVAFVILVSDSPDAPGNFATVRPADRNQLRRTEAITALRQFAGNRRPPVPCLRSEDQQPPCCAPRRGKARGGGICY